MLETIILTIPDENLDARSVVSLGEIPMDLTKMLVIDVSNVRFADSSGLGWLVRLHLAHPGQVSMRKIHPMLERCLKRIDSRMRQPLDDHPQAPIRRIVRQLSNEITTDSVTPSLAE